MTGNGRCSDRPGHRPGARIPLRSQRQRPSAADETTPGRWSDYVARSRPGHPRTTTIEVNSSPNSRFRPSWTAIRPLSRSSSGGTRRSANRGRITPNRRPYRRVPPPRQRTDVPGKPHPRQGTSRGRPAEIRDSQERGHQTPSMPHTGTPPNTHTGLMRRSQHLALPRANHPINPPGKGPSRRRSLVATVTVVFPTAHITLMIVPHRSARCAPARAARCGRGRCRSADATTGTPLPTAVRAAGGARPGRGPRPRNVSWPRGQ